MLIDKFTFDALTDAAKQSERKRMNLDMRNSAEDSSQRMLNALEPGTVLPIHRHRNSSETLIVLRGAVKQCFYDDFGNLVKSFILKPNSDKVGISTPIGQWHSTIALESGTIIFEAKDGAYQPLTSVDILDK
jgi:cupin fold WbuC family metalloprotein